MQALPSGPITIPCLFGQANAQLRVPIVGVLHGAINLLMAPNLHPVLTVTEYELCMQAWLKDSLIDIQETLIERVQI